MIYTLTLNPAIDRELTVPSLAFDDVLRASDTRTDLGGKGINVSRMLASLHAPSVALGFAGGRTGQALGDGLAALGITADFTQIGGETRTNVSIVAADHSQHIKANESGPLISEEEQAALLAQITRLAQPGDWWVLAGSLPPGIASSFYAQIIALVKAAGGNTMLDTSGAALTAAVGAGPLVAKPNAAEASQLTGLPVDTPEQAIAAASAMAGIETVVISMGSQGAVLAQGGRGWLAKPPRIHERNPIGAGDSLVAGLVWGLSQGNALDALRLGVACGAATASHSGTEVGTHDEVLRLAEQVEIQAL